MKAISKKTATGIKIGRVIRGLQAMRKRRKVLPRAVFQKLVQKLAA